MKRMRLFIVLLAILNLVNIDGFAQRNRNRNKDKKEEISVDSMMKAYRFDEAVEKIEDEIAKAKKRKKNIDDLEEKLGKARAASVMLSGTEKVFFIDSIVVDKKSFLSGFRIGEESGTLNYTETLLPDNLKQLPSLGNVAFGNELQDKIYFALHPKTGMAGLFMTARVGEHWSHPKALKGLAAQGSLQDYPYVLSDGVTLYYADKKEEGLGGYDIYVTRYNSDSESFLKPDNLGMPFNSPANDYMYVIDEVNHIGWFASDRNQPEGKVCIYIFEPNDTRIVYNKVAMGDEGMRNAARIHSIKDNLLNKVSLSRAKNRINSIVANHSSGNYSKKVRFIISDDQVYTSLLDFKSEKALQFAMEWNREKDRLALEEKKLAVMRKNYIHAEATADEKSKLQAQETLVGGLRDLVKVLAKNMRKAEITGE